MVAMTRTKLIGARDPNGIRPLVYGDLDGKPIFASETCALDIIGAKFVRDVENGEVIVCEIQPDGSITIDSLKPFPPKPERLCLFEYVYFARPDSMVGGRSVYSARKRMGINLAEEAPVEADVVVPVPDGGTPAAIGFAQASGIPFEFGIIRNHYVGPHLHRADPADPRLRGQAQALGQPRADRRQARGAGRRFDRARHNFAQDRADDARSRRARGAYAGGKPDDHPFRLLRHRHARPGKAAGQPVSRP